MYLTICASYEQVVQHILQFLIPLIITKRRNSARFSKETKIISS